MLRHSVAISSKNPQTLSQSTLGDIVEFHRNDGCAYRDMTPIYGNVNLVPSKDKERENFNVNLRIAAVFSDRFDIVEFLDSQDARNRLPLTFSPRFSKKINHHFFFWLSFVLKEPRKQYLLWLLENNRFVEAGITKWHIEALLNPEKFLKALQQNGDEINQPDVIGLTPLHYLLLDDNFDQLSDEVFSLIPKDKIDFFEIIHTDLQKSKGFDLPHHNKPFVNLYTQYGKMELLSFISQKLSDDRFYQCSKAARSHFPQLILDLARTKTPVEYILNRFILFNINDAAKLKLKLNQIESSIPLILAAHECYETITLFLWKAQINLNEVNPDLHPLSFGAILIRNGQLKLLNRILDWDAEFCLENSSQIQSMNVFNTSIVRSILSSVVSQVDLAAMLCEHGFFGTKILIRLCIRRLASFEKSDQKAYIVLDWINREINALKQLEALEENNDLEGLKALQNKYSTIFKNATNPPNDDLPKKEKSSTPKPPVIKLSSTIPEPIQADKKQTGIKSTIDLINCYKKIFANKAIDITITIYVKDKKELTKVLLDEFKSVAQGTKITVDPVVDESGKKCGTTQVQFGGNKDQVKIAYDALKKINLKPGLYKQYSNKEASFSIHCKNAVLYTGFENNQLQSNIMKGPVNLKDNYKDVSSKTPFVLTDDKKDQLIKIIKKGFCNASNVKVEWFNDHIVVNLPASNVKWEHSPAKTQEKNKPACIVPNEFISSKILSRFDKEMLRCDANFDDRTVHIYLHPNAYEEDFVSLSKRSNNIYDQVYKDLPSEIEANLPIQVPEKPTEQDTNIPVTAHTGGSSAFSASQIKAVFAKVMGDPNRTFDYLKATTKKKKTILTLDVYANPGIGELSTLDVFKSLTAIINEEVPGLITMFPPNKDPVWTIVVDGAIALIDQLNEENCLARMQSKFKEWKDARDEEYIEENVVLISQLAPSSTPSKAEENIRFKCTFTNIGFANLKYHLEEIENIPLQDETYSDAYCMHLQQIFLLIKNTLVVDEKNLSGEVKTLLGDWHDILYRIENNKTTNYLLALRSELNILFSSLQNHLLNKYQATLYGGSKILTVILNHNLLQQFDKAIKDLPAKEVNVNGFVQYCWERIQTLKSLDDVVVPELQVRALLRMYALIGNLKYQDIQAACEMSVEEYKLAQEIYQKQLKGDEPYPSLEKQLIEKLTVHSNRDDKVINY